MNSPLVNSPDALVKVLVVTPEPIVKVEVFEATEHQHHTAIAESTTLLDNERQIERTYAAHGDDRVLPTDTDQSSVTSNNTSPNQNQNIEPRQHHQNCDSVKEADAEASQLATTYDLNSRCQSGTSNTIDYHSGNVTTRTAHKRLRLARSWCLW